MAIWATGVPFTKGDIYLMGQKSDPKSHSRVSCFWREGTRHRKSHSFCLFSLLASKCWYPLKFGWSLKFGCGVGGWRGSLLQNSKAWDFLLLSSLVLCPGTAGGSFQSLCSIVLFSRVSIENPDLLHHPFAAAWLSSGEITGVIT